MKIKRYVFAWIIAFISLSLSSFNKWTWWICISVLGGKNDFDDSDEDDCSGSVIPTAQDFEAQQDERFNWFKTSTQILSLNNHESLKSSM